MLAPDILCMQEVERPVYETQLTESLTDFQVSG